MPLLLIYNLAIVAAALVGGLLPLVRGWSERVLHLFVAVATGVFLGTTFVHLLPEFAALDPGRGPWSLLGISIVLLFAIERIGLQSSQESGGHAVLGHATLIGLAVHSVAAGYALGVGRDDDLQRVLFVAMVAHKSVEAFSLTTVLLLAERSRTAVISMVLFLSMMVPLGTMLGRLTTAALDERAIVVPLALGTGTFIYVSLCDLLPEVFHHREDAWLKVLIIVVGVVATMLLHIH